MGGLVFGNSDVVEQKEEPARLKRGKCFRFCYFCTLARSAESRQQLQKLRVEGVKTSGNVSFCSRTPGFSRAGCSKVKTGCGRRHGTGVRKSVRPAGCLSCVQNVNLFDTVAGMDDEASYVCDACGEEIVVPIDLSAGESQQYVEDCPVCCRPNVIHVEVDEGGDVRVWSEAE